MAEISIIVPIYNAKQTLVRCIESILEQEVDDYEILLIDDGSTDGSDLICKEFADSNSSIRYYYQPNSGVSAARNKGLDNAQGKYISFVDSDDSLNRDFLKVGISAFNDNPSCKMFISGIKVIYDGRQKKEGVYSDIYGKANDFSEETLCELLDKDYFSRVVGMIIEKEFIGKSKFADNMKFGEDLNFVIELLHRNPEIKISSNVLYNHFRLENSLRSHSDIMKCKDVLITYNTLYNYGTFKGYNVNGLFFQKISARWKDDFLTIEAMILRDDMSYISKIKRLRVLCSDKFLVEKLRLFNDNYINMYAIHPYTLIIGYIISKWKRGNR